MGSYFAHRQRRSNVKYSVSCKICFVDKIKRIICIYVKKTSLTEKFLFRKTLVSFVRPACTFYSYILRMCWCRSGPNTNQTWLPKPQAVQKHRGAGQVNKTLLLCNLKHFCLQDGFPHRAIITGAKASQLQGQVSGTY